MFAVQPLRAATSIEEVEQSGAGVTSTTLHTLCMRAAALHS